MNTNLQTSFLGCLQNLHFRNKEIDITEIIDIIQHHSYLASASNMTPTLFLMNNKTNNYLLVSDNVKQLTGYDAKYFMDGGLSSFLKLYDKSDLTILNEKIFPKNNSIIESIPKFELQNYIFTHDFRINKKNKEQVRLYLRNKIISTSNSNIPLYSLKIVSCIDHIKKDNSIIHHIEKQKTNHHGTEQEIVFSSTYYPANKLFSKREIDILLCIELGLNTKEIAAKFSISEATVNNQRGHMLLKSNTKNVAQLIAYAIRNNVV